MTVGLRTKSTSVQGREFFVGDGAVAIPLTADDYGIWLQETRKFSQGDTLRPNTSIQVKPGYVSAADLKQGDVYVILEGIDFKLPARTPDQRGRIINLEPNPSGFRAVSASPDGKLIAVASVSELAIIDAETGVRRTPRTTIRPGYPADVVFAPDGDHVAATGSFGPKLWDIRDGQAVLVMPDREEQTIKAIPGSSLSYGVAIHPDGKRFATVGINFLRIWKHQIDAPEGDKPVAELERTIMTNDNGSIHATHVAFDPEGKRIATSARNWTAQSDAPFEIKIWDTDSGQLIGRIEGGGNGLAFSPDGRWIVSPMQPSSHQIGIWDVDNGKLARTLDGHTGVITEVAFDPTGRYLASSSGDSTVRLWRFGTGNLVSVLKGHIAGVTDISFDPNGAYLASVCPKTPSQLILWDLSRIAASSAAE